MAQRTGGKWTEKGSEVGVTRAWGRWTGMCGEERPDSDREEVTVGTRPGKGLGPEDQGIGVGD